MPKKIAIIALIIVAVIVIIGTVICNTLRKEEKEMEKEDGVGIIPKPSSISKPEIDTSDWKIYRDEKYRYQFKYPGNWIVEEEFFKPQIYIGEKSADPTLSQTHFIMVVVNEREEMEETLRVLREAKAESPKEAKLEDITLPSGVKGFKFFFIGMPERDSAYLYSPTNDYLVSVEINCPFDYKNLFNNEDWRLCKETYYAILSSFRFY